MKLAVFQVVSALQKTGGIQRVAFALTERFPAAGVQLSTRTLRPVDAPQLVGKGTWRSSPRLAKLVERLPNRHLASLVAIPSFALIATLAARRQAKAVRLIHGESFVGDVFVAHSCHRAAVAAKWAAGGRRWLFYPLHWFQLLREAWVFRCRSPHLIALSQGVGAEFRKYHRVPEEKIWFIPNGVEHNEFKPAADKRALREKLGLPEDVFLLVFVGHEFERKGLAYIIRALAQCRGGGQPQLLVLGKDEPAPYRELARTLGLEDRVRFLGSRQNVGDYYAAADLFVLLSNYESCCLVGLEAMASGLPAVVSSVNGIDDYVQDGVNGIFVERNAASLAAALERIFADPALYGRLAAAARPSTEAYGWDEIARRYLEVLRVVQERKGSSGLGKEAK